MNWGLLIIFSLALILYYFGWEVKVEVEWHPKIEKFFKWLKKLFRNGV